MAVSTTGLNGAADLVQKLRDLVPKMRKRVIRNALAAGARIVRDAARANAPQLAIGSRNKYRARGTLKKAISVRTSKAAGRAGDVGVFVNVRPAKGQARGAKSRTDPYYWRFQEFGFNPNGGKKRSAAQRSGRRLAGQLRSGGKRVPGQRFLTNASALLPKSLAVFEQQVGQWITKVNTTGKITE